MRPSRTMSVQTDRTTTPANVPKCAAVRSTTAPDVVRVLRSARIASPRPTPLPPPDRHAGPDNAPIPAWYGAGTRHSKNSAAIQAAHVSPAVHRGAYVDSAHCATPHHKHSPQRVLWRPNLRQSKAEMNTAWGLAGRRGTL